MDQKKVFTIIAGLLVLQGLGIFFFSDQIASDSFPELSKQGLWAVAEMATVVAVLYISLGVITFSVREFPKALSAFAIGFFLIVLNTSKHLFITEMAVPLPLYLLQVLLLLSFIFLMTKSKKQSI